MKYCLVGNRVFLSDSGKALDMEISVAIGGDTEQEIQKLENTTRKLKNILQDAKGLAVAAEEAAAKCKVVLSHPDQLYKNH